VGELELRLHVGNTPEERSFPQRVTMNVEVELDVLSSAKSGKLKDTVCYLKLVRLISEHAASQKWILIEQLAEEVAMLIFETFSAALNVKLQINKFVVPNVKFVGIEIFRERSENATT